MAAVKAKPKAKVKAKPMGRPPFKITKAVCKKAEKLAKQGLMLHQIATSLGISRDTLNEKKRDFPDFFDALERGRVAGIENMTNILIKNAKKGDTGAVKYWLNNRDPDNWKDRRVTETTLTASIKYSELPGEELDRKLKELELEEQRSREG